MLSALVRKSPSATRLPIEAIGVFIRLTMARAYTKRHPKWAHKTTLLPPPHVRFKRVMEMVMQDYELDFAVALEAAAIAKRLERNG